MYLFTSIQAFELRAGEQVGGEVAAPALDDRSDQHDGHDHRAAEEAPLQLRSGLGQPFVVVAIVSARLLALLYASWANRESIAVGEAA